MFKGLYFSVACPTLTSPASGNFTLTTDGTQSTAMFSCTNGYHIEGAATLSCDSSGVWTDIEPVCSKYNPFLCKFYTIYGWGSINGHVV